MARLPVNQLVMHKLAINQSLYAQGLAGTQALSVFFDGIARHTPEGFAFQEEAAREGFRRGGPRARRAVRRLRARSRRLNMATRGRAPTSSRRVGELSSATWAYAGLSAAFELGIVRALDGAGDRRGARPTRLDLDPELVADLLGVLVALGAVERRGDALRRAPPTSSPSAPARCRG